MAIDIEQFRVKNAPDTLFYIPNFISEDEEQMLLSQVYKVPRTKWTVLSHRRLQNWGGLPGPKGMVAEDLPQWLSAYAQKISDLGAFGGKVPNHVLVNEYEAGQGIMPHEDGPAFYPTVSTISLGSHTVLDFYCHLSASSGDVKPGAGQSGAEPDSGVAVSTSKTKTPGTETGRDKNACCSCGSDRCEGDHPCQPACSRLDGGESVCGVQHEGGDTSLDSRHFLSLLLQPRSLVLVQDDMYKVHLHGIKEVTQDTLTDKVANLDLVPEVKEGDVLERRTRVSLTIRYVPKVLKAKLIFGKR